MKPLLAAAVLLSLSAAAQAKPTPLEPQRLALANDDFGMFVGAAGAMLESDYFHAPQTPPASARVFPCRLQLQVFSTTRLAQSCH